MRTITKAVNRGIEGLLFCGMCVLILVTFLQVLCRFVLKIPVSWSEEVARLSFVWMIFLGSALGVREGSHLSLEILTAALPERLQRYMKILMNLTVAGIAAVILWYGWNYVVRSVGKTAVTLPIPANCVYIAAPVSAIVMILNAWENVWEEWRKGDRI